MTNFPIEISPEALAQAKRIIERKGTPGQFLRLGVKGGGCSGFEYVIRLDDHATDFDIETVQDGVKIVTDTKSLRLLEGAKLVFTGNLMGGGFQFENPNVKKSCGCGTSFTPIDKPADAK